MPETTEPADTVPAPVREPGEQPGGTGGTRHGRPWWSAWLHALGWAGLTIAVLTPFAVAGAPERSALASLVAVSLPALVVAAVCALVASRSTSSWSWWLFPPIVVLPAVALVVLTDLAPDSMGSSGQDAVRGDRSLAVPERAGTWTVQTGPGAEEQEAELQARILRADESLRAVYGEYRRSGDDVLIYNGVNVSADSDLARELVARPDDALLDYLDGTGIADVAEVPAGELGGAMACGTVPQLGPYVDLLVCGWADSGGIGTATYRVDGINRESAAETTRVFRSDVTVVD